MSSPSSHHGRSPNGRAPKKPASQPGAHEIQSRMDELRRGMRDEVAEVSKRAKQAVHWRYYVRRFPLASAAVAAVAGYLLTPTSKQVVRPSDEQIRRLAQQGRLHLYASSEAAKQRTVTQRGLLILGTVAARAAMAYVGKRVGEAAEGAPHGGRLPAGDAPE